MRLWEVEAALQKLQSFASPNVQYEQYPTPAHLASHMIHSAYSIFDDIEGKIVADLGVGAGMLSVAAGLLDAGHLIGIDIDPRAVEIADLNIKQALDVDCDLFVGDVRDFEFLSGKIDTVIMNPPFGTKSNAGIDVMFLQRALKFAPVVYSLHKSTTRKYLFQRSKALGATCELVAELRYDIPRMYKFHKKASLDIEVDFLRFERT